MVWFRVQWYGLGLSGAVCGSVMCFGVQWYGLGLGGAVWCDLVMLSYSFGGDGLTFSALSQSMSSLCLLEVVTISSSVCLTGASVVTDR